MPKFAGFTHTVKGPKGGDRQLRVEVDVEASEVTLSLDGRAVFVADWATVCDEFSQLAFDTPVELTKPEHSIKVNVSAEDVEKVAKSKRRSKGGPA